MFLECLFTWQGLKAFITEQPHCMTIMTGSGKYHVEDSHRDLSFQGWGFGQPGKWLVKNGFVVVCLKNGRPLR